MFDDLCSKMMPKIGPTFDTTFAQFGIVLLILGTHFGGTLFETFVETFLDVFGTLCCILLGFLFGPFLWPFVSILSFTFPKCWPERNAATSNVTLQLTLPRLHLITRFPLFYQRMWVWDIRYEKCKSTLTRRSSEVGGFQNRHQIFTKTSPTLYWITTKVSPTHRRIITQNMT